MTTSGLSPSGWLTATAGQFPASPDLDRLLQVGWSAASAMLLLAILAGSVHAEPALPSLGARQYGWRPRAYLRGYRTRHCGAAGSAHRRTALADAVPFRCTGIGHRP